jgi:hypothetical protein
MDTKEAVDTLKALSTTIENSITGLSSQRDAIAIAISQLSGTLVTEDLRSQPAIDAITEKCNLAVEDKAQIQKQYDQSLQDLQAEKELHASDMASLQDEIAVLQIPAEDEKGMQDVSTLVETPIDTTIRL